MTQSYESSIESNAAGANLRITPTLITFDEIQCYFDFMPDTKWADDRTKGFFLLEANNLIGPMPTIGSPHPKYSTAILQAKDLQPMTGDSTTHVRAVLHYAMPGDFSSVEYDTYQQTVASTFAMDQEDISKLGMPPGALGTANKTNVTIITYAPTNSSFVGAPAPGQALPLNPAQYRPRVTQINVPDLVRSVRITQYEVIPNALPSNVSSSLTSESIDKGQAFRPVWNSDDIWGFQPGSILFVGCQSTTEGTSLYRRVYTFLVNRFGWHHFYALFHRADGVVPMDITPIDPTTVDPTTETIHTNGSAAWRMLPNAKFADQFPQIKPPFGQTLASPAPDPTGGP